MIYSLNKLPTSVNIGGVPFEIEYREEFHSRWQSFLSIGKFSIGTTYESKSLGNRNIHSCVWEAIWKTLLEDIYFFNTTPMWNDHSSAMCSLMTECIFNLPDIKEGINSYFFNIGGKEVRIEIDTDDTMDRGVYGIFCASAMRITLCRKDIRARDYKEQFLYQVLLHELFHTCAYLCGLHESEWNSEHTNNTIVFGLTAALMSLKYEENPIFISTKLTNNESNSERLQAV